MKIFVEHLNRMAKHLDPLASVGDGLVILFAVLGNGYNLDNCGYIQQIARDDELPDLPEPTGLRWIYPYSKEKEYQPFNLLKGCRNPGFKELLLHFIACIELTDDNITDIKEWKDNIDSLYKVLNAPLFNGPQLDKNDMDTFLNLIKDEQCTYQTTRDDTQLPKKDSVYKTWFFDVQWSDCPVSIQDEVRILWDRHNLGNDLFCIKQKLSDHFFEYYPLTYMWLKHKGVSEGETFVIHWWW